MSVHVSCILATGNRRAFARQAIRYFLRQTYDDSELIVVDDGPEPVADLCAGLCRVVHVRLNEPTLLGTKLNVGVAHASGRVIQKLDDDDYYHPEFLERAVAALPKNPSCGAVVTWDCFLVLLAGETLLRFSGHGWTTGGTFCFHRDLFKRGGFRQIPRHVDIGFIQDHQPTLIKVCEPHQYVLVRHGANTWTELRAGSRVDDYLRSLPVHSSALADVVEPIDRAFYESLVWTDGT
jgi:glycosyltransferase involved in cell wall biosynthesis